MNRNVLKILGIVSMLIDHVGLVFFQVRSFSYVFYNGEKGKYNMKYFFYVFYPIHLLLLYVIRLVM